MHAGTRVCGLALGGMLALLSGCGLNIMVTANPPAPQMGQNTDFTAMVKNQTQCTVFNAELLVATFIPPGVIPGDGNFCDLITAIPPDRLDELQNMLGTVFSPAEVASAMQRAQDRFFGIAAAGGGQAVPQCVADDSGGGQGSIAGGVINFDCDLGVIDPLAKVTVNFSASAPFGGKVRTIAVAFGEVPSDMSCFPAVDGMGFVAGCFDSAGGVQPAPAMSFGGLAATAVALLGAGTVMIWRRRR